MGWSDDTSIGGRQAAFPSTPSAVLGVRSDDPVARGRAFNTLVRVYWKPVYKHVRLRWRKDNEEAKDLTQAFFVRALERGVFETYDPSRAKFRTFMKTCLNNYLANAEEARRRIKRGGAAMMLSLDFDEAEDELLVAPDGDPEEQFDREWARSLHAMGVQELRAELQERGKDVYFELFRRYDLCDDEAQRPTYQRLAQEFGLKASDVTNHLAAARRRFRAVVLDKLRQVTATEEEFRSEAQAVLGIEPSEAV